MPELPARHVRRVHRPKADRLRPDRRVPLRQVQALLQEHRALRQARPDHKVHRPDKACRVPELPGQRARRALPQELSLDRVCLAV